MRIVWIVTGILAAAAILVGTHRLYAPAPEHDPVAHMTALLDMDPRVRLEETRRAVAAVAALVQTGALDSPGAHYGAALHFHYLAHDPERAEEAYRRVIAERPDWAWPHNSLAVLLYTQERRDEALEAFDAAMRLDPSWSRPHSDLAIFFRLEGRLDEAADEARKALELAPYNAAANNNYGVILDMKGDKDGAESYYRRAIEVAPEIPSPYYNLASLSMRRGDPEQAIALLETAVGLETAFRRELANDPDFAPILDDPRVQAIIAPVAGPQE